MNNSPSSSSSSSSSTNTKTTHDDTHTAKPSTTHILDVMFDYAASGDDELTLRRGSKLEVLSKDESISGSRGWWTGRLVDSNSVGIFPSNFVADPQPNLRIIDYNDLQIGDTIGVGGFGHVFHGQFGDVDVAIKTAKSLTSFCSMQTATNKSVDDDDDDTSDAVQKSLIDSLLREARLFSNLKHRNIIQLFGVSVSLPIRNLYLVMEYAHGGALNRLLQERQLGLHRNVFIQYAQQIADGMKYLHETACEHIIHRDLKCSNILILESIVDIYNDSDLLVKTLKITDFGLARKQLQSSSMSAAGTFAWMSPECIRNNEFSTKSDVWSYGVLLWECLTGELPYKGFDQMQVAFGIANNKYSLPIPSTCPEEYSQLMKNCWKMSPQERPTFGDLLDDIHRIIANNSTHDLVHPTGSTEESYQSLQEDWRQEIQDMFNELKEKEQEIRDLEQVITQRSLEQNHQRLQLERWEQQLHEREMHIVECELKLLMANNAQERLQHQTPKIQKRSGRFMRSFLNGHTNLSPSATHMISSPTNFRHLISVCHNPPAIEHNFSPTTSTPPLCCPLNSPLTILSNSPNKPSYHHQHHEFYSSSSTPTTPNLARLRTLTFHYPTNPDGSHPPTPPAKPPRSISQSKAAEHRSTSHKSKSSSSSLALKRKFGKNNDSHAEAKWYLETLSSINTNNNNNNDTATISSTKSTPILDRPSRKPGSSSSSCSTPNDRSLARAIFDIGSMLSHIGLGRRVRPPSAISSPSTTTTPSPRTKKQYQRKSSPSFTDNSSHPMELATVNYRTRPYSSPVRPNSLVLSSSPIDSISSSQNYSIRTARGDDDNDKYYSAQSSNISTPMMQSLAHSSNLRTLEQPGAFASTLDVLHSQPARIRPSPIESHPHSDDKHLLP